MIQNIVLTIHPHNLLLLLDAGTEEAVWVISMIKYVNKQQVVGASSHSSERYETTQQWLFRFDPTTAAYLADLRGKNEIDFLFSLAQDEW